MKWISSYYSHVSTDIISQYETWFRFIHETLSDGTIRDVYGLQGGNTGDIREITYKTIVK